MKKIFLLITIAICSIASAQVPDIIQQQDTVVSITNSPQGFHRKASPISFQWNLLQKKISLTVMVFTYDASGVLITNQAIMPYTVMIDTDGIWVDSSTGIEVPQGTAGAVPQYPFLRAVSLQPVSLMGLLLKYIQVGDSNGAFN